MSDTLGDALPREQARCRELLRQYHDMAQLRARARKHDPGLDMSGLLPVVCA